MSESTDSGVLPATDDWLLAPDDKGSRRTDDDPPGPSATGRLVANRTALLVVGGIAGAAIVAALHQGGGTAPTQTVNAGAIPNGIPGGAFPAGPGAGGLPGEQHVAGTLTAIGASSITVRAAGGMHTYSITSTTLIVRDGVSASLASLRVGDAVLVHVFPTATGTGSVVERVIARS